MNTSRPSTYADCVTSLSHSLSFLSSSVQTLSTATSDLPRLSTTLRTTRHYELIPQPSLAAAEASLKDEIGPFIALLLDRAEAQVERQERRIETLKARSELLSGRTAAGNLEGDDAQAQKPSPATGSSRHKHKRAGSRGETLGGEGKLRARAARTRKEGLKYGVDRLEMELEQKEKELRKRLEKA